MTTYTLAKLRLSGKKCHKSPIYPKCCERKIRIRTSHGNLRNFVWTLDLATSNPHPPRIRSRNFSLRELADTTAVPEGYRHFFNVNVPTTFTLLFLPKEQIFVTASSAYSCAAAVYGSATTSRVCRVQYNCLSHCFHCFHCCRSRYCLLLIVESFLAQR